MTDNPPEPVPRLRHVRPGQQVILAGDKTTRVLLSADNHYGYFDRMKASLCHEVDKSLMVFGDGAGWRVK